MSRQVHPNTSIIDGFPRSRGDEPDPGVRLYYNKGFSPLTRG